MQAEKKSFFSLETILYLPLCIQSAPKHSHCITVVLDKFHPGPFFSIIFRRQKCKWNQVSTIFNHQALFLLLNDTFATWSPLLKGNFDCDGWVKLPKVFLLKTFRARFANHVRLQVSLRCWYLIAAIANRTVTNFSPTRFSRCIMHGIAWEISIIAFSFPSSPLRIAWDIISIFCSTIRSLFNLICRSSTPPKRGKRCKRNSAVTRLLKKHCASAKFAALSPFGI